MPQPGKGRRRVLLGWDGDAAALKRLVEDALIRVLDGDHFAFERGRVGNSHWFATRTWKIWLSRSYRRGFAFYLWCDQPPDKQWDAESLERVMDALVAELGRRGLASTTTPLEGAS